MSEHIIRSRNIYLPGDLSHWFVILSLCRWMEPEITPWPLQEIIDWTCMVNINVSSISSHSLLVLSSSHPFVAPFPHIPPPLCIACPLLCYLPITSLPPTYFRPAPSFQCATLPSLSPLLPSLPLAFVFSSSSSPNPFLLFLLSFPLFLLFLFSFPFLLFLLYNSFFLLFLFSFSIFTLPPLLSLLFTLLLLLSFFYSSSSTFPSFYLSSSPFPFFLLFLFCSPFFTLPSLLSLPPLPSPLFTLPFLHPPLLTLPPLPSPHFTLPLLHSLLSPPPCSSNSTILDVFHIFSSIP